MDTKPSIFRSPCSVNWEEFEKKLLGNENAIALVRSTVKDLEASVDKMETVNKLISAKKGRDIQNSLQEQLDDLNESLKSVDEITRLAQMPTTIEKEQGITEWGRTEEIKSLKIS